jgi:hypothetical protein
MSSEEPTKEMWWTQRSLQLMGGASKSFYVALPMEWAKIMGLKQGMPINVYWHPSKEYVIVALPESKKEKS